MIFLMFVRNYNVSIALVTSEEVFSQDRSNKTKETSQDSCKSGHMKVFPGKEIVRYNFSILETS